MGRCMCGHRDAYNGRTDKRNELGVVIQNAEIGRMGSSGQHRTKICRSRFIPLDSGIAAIVIRKRHISVPGLQPSRMRRGVQTDVLRHRAPGAAVMPFRGGPSARGDMPVCEQGIRVLHHHVNGGRSFANGFADGMIQIFIAGRNKRVLLSGICRVCKRTKSNYT